MSDYLQNTEVDEGGPFDAGNAKHVRKREQKGARDNKSRDAVLSGVMDLPEGRRWVFWLLEQTHMFHSSFSQNAMTMAYKEGARNIGLMLMAEIHRVAPEQYLLMMKERKDE